MPARTTIFDFLQTLKKQGEHGEAFAYKTCNTEVLGWIVQRVAGKSFGELVSERIWQKLGAEEDGYIMVDSTGMAMCGGRPEPHRCAISRASAR